MDIQELHSRFLTCNGVSIDTRKIVPGSLFVAIKGERFDANTFAAEALEKGAACVVIDNPDSLIDERTILVRDSLKALQELAAYHRAYLNIPIVALTGSNGKTTTKELIYGVLSTKYRTVATIGNLNNHIGVPLTLLSFSSDTEIGIVEMGANHQKEIAFLCELAQPDYGYITNFGKAHLEGFGGTEGVIKGKSEMYAYLSQHQKLAFVNADDDLQMQKTEQMRRFTFGSETSADIAISAVSASPYVEISCKGITFRSNMIGLYNAANISAAVAIGFYFDVPAAQIHRAIESYKPENNRSQILVKSGNEIILDAYNANPSSMAVAIENFLQLDNPGKVLILGDMFELGTESLREHAAVLQLLANERKAECHFVGNDFFAVQFSRPNFHFHKTYDDLAATIATRNFSNCRILIKGSRGMALERVLEKL